MLFKLCHVEHRVYLQAVAPGMIKQRKGRIVVVGSITAFLASPFNGAYAVACHPPCAWEHPLALMGKSPIVVLKSMA